MNKLTIEMLKKAVNNVNEMYAEEGKYLGNTVMLDNDRLIFQNLDMDQGLIANTYVVENFDNRKYMLKVMLEQEYEKKADYGQSFQDFVEVYNNMSTIVAFCERFGKLIDQTN